MAKNKVSSYAVAILVAIVSFFVIFFFFSGTSEKLFGVSVKNGEIDINQVKQDVSKSVKEKVETVTDSAADRLGSEIQKLISSDN